MSPAPDFPGLSLAELRFWAEAIGIGAYRGTQIHTGLWRQGARRFTEVKGLPRELALRLDREFRLFPAEEARRQESADGTVKSLLRLADGRLVECVSIPAADRHTVCVSSQVGCAVGCSFCASGLNGVERDLSSGEITAQVLHHQRSRPVSNVVFMGSGEPFFNYPAVLGAIRALGDEGGLNLGRRRFTVSTSGVPERIRQFGRDEPQATLALSLHAADDETRSRLVPLNRRWPLAELMAAMEDYSALVSRRITFEYVLLADANMSEGHAIRLAQLALRHRAHINLIAFNTVEGLPHRRPTGEEVERFAALVADHGGHLTLRASRGADIAAACGQLKRREADPTA